MGTIKDKSKKKLKVFYVRVTETEYETIKRNAVEAGYGSSTHFMIDIAIKATASRADKASFRQPVDKEQWSRDTVDSLRQNTTKVVKSYNALYEQMNDETERLQDGAYRRQVLRRMSRLDVYTRKLVDLFEKIREILINKSE